MQVKTITLKIACGNDAFVGENGVFELHSIFERALSWASHELSSDGIQKKVKFHIRDSNGNTCATLTVEKENE
jgi:hypothetical protein